MTQRPADVAWREAVLGREEPAGDLDARIEALHAIGPGTDEHLVGDLLGTAAEWLSGADGVPVDARGALLFKAPKPAQDRRADLPVIGPDTARGAVAAGLSAIVVEAGGVIVLDAPQVIATLDRAGACFWVRPKGGA